MTTGRRQLLGDASRLGGRRRDAAARHGDAEVGEDALRLVLVDLHLSTHSRSRMIPFRPMAEGEGFPTSRPNPGLRAVIALAEGEGFEPPSGQAEAVFKTAALSRSATPPGVAV